MQHINAEIRGPVSPYTGSESTYEMVKNQIAERWGNEEAERYDPYTNCLTFREWLARGYRVRKGEKALRSVTFIGPKGEEGTEEDATTKRYPKKVFLFYRLQVDKLPDSV